MWWSEKDWNAMLITAAIVFGLIGYGVIRGIEWLWSHVSFSWN